jgi:hypothetical protein
MAVTQVMEPHPPQFRFLEENLERVTKAAGLQRLAIRSHYDTVIIGQAHSKPKQAFGLPKPMLL